MTACIGRTFTAVLAAAWLCACGTPGGQGDTDADDVPADPPDAAAPADVPGGDDGAEAGDPGAADPGGADIPVVQAAILTSGEARLTVDVETRTIALRRGDDLLLRFPSDGLRLGVVDAYDAGVAYDPWPLYPAAGLEGMDVPPAGLRWIDPASIAIGDTGPTTVSLDLAYPEGVTAALVLRAEAAGRFSALLKPSSAEGGPVVAFVRLRPRAGADEAFYGLGAFYDRVEHRGTTRALQIEVDLAIESGYNEGHVRVPFLIGTRGWGLFAATYRPAVFDVAVQEDDLVEATIGTGPASGEGLAFHLFAAAHPLDITRQYYDVTGDPVLPAKWALGPLMWRDETTGQAEVLADLKKVRDLDLAASGFWIDRPYASGVNSFDFKPADYPDPKGMIDQAHDLGFRLSLWHTPYVGDDDPATADLKAEADAKGYFPPDFGILFNKWGRPVDLTNPAAYSWWQGLIRRYTDLGIEGFKLDYGEDVQVGLFGSRGGTEWLFADGSDDRTMSHGFQLGYHKVYAETLPPEGGFLLVRNSTWGDQVHASVIWPGDADASFAAHYEPAIDADGNSYVSVGGLPATVIYGLSLGPSGFPFFGMDTGGYRHAGPPDRELFARWFQQTALSSVMQVGNNASTMPWDFQTADGKPLYDEEMLGWYRDYARLHLRLFAYEWTLAKRIAVDGRPIQRPVGLAYPEAGRHPSDEYLFGDDLLVAPVMARGAVERTVFFPPGRWIDWFDGVAYEGGKDATVPAPLGKLPLFLRSGGIVPMLRPTIDSVAPVADPLTVDSYATTPGVLWARVFPGAASTFEVFDQTLLKQERTADAIRLVYLPGTEFGLGAAFEVMGLDGPPATVTIDDQEAGAAVTWVDGAGGILRVEVPAGPHLVEISTMSGGRPGPR